MLSGYAYTIPMIILILFIENKKRRFLRDARKEDVDIRNINHKSLNSKTYLYYLFVVFFAIVYKDTVMTIRENVDPAYIGRLISAILPIFIILSLVFLRTNKDFYIKDNLIHFPFIPSCEIFKDYYFEEISNDKHYTTLRVIDNEGNGKAFKNVKLNVYNEIYSKNNNYFKMFK